MTDDEFPPDAENQEASYEVGYRKPPRHSQFKSGNKHGKGRPRGSRNMKSIVRDVLEDKIPVKINGKTRKVSPVELGLRQLVRKANAGDLKAISQVLTLGERYSPPDDDTPIPEEEAAYALETIKHYLLMQGDFGDE
ncbi:DUF5681 domain-containing protein [Sphingobium baderi]|uniref:DUF5681 domain-containing protein n=1 Tax=Sphingobium baderi TaxID=1332080 RepID=A0A0S3EWI1_9SPHN|nr:DUF5681 domain-containing protein [Sphingobium baderi]ALR19786.1 hypothetical protein ATN00_05135 [Sphingobium baderi]